MKNVHRLPQTPIFATLLAIALFTVRHGRADAPTGRYTDKGNGTVLDTKTGLLWQQSTSGTTYNWSDATTYCAGLNLDGPGWRLPSMKELQTLVDDSRMSPAIDATTFPGTPSIYFWTSSSLAGSASNAWIVSFDLGYSYYGVVTNAYRVRCVR